jgi:hypothetical protein
VRIADGFGGAGMARVRRGMAGAGGAAVRGRGLVVRRNLLRTSSRSEWYQIRALNVDGWAGKMQSIDTHVSLFFYSFFFFYLVIISQMV